MGKLSSASEPSVSTPMYVKLMARWDMLWAPSDTVAFEALLAAGDDGVNSVPSAAKKRGVRGVNCCPLSETVKGSGKSPSSPRKPKRCEMLSSRAGVVHSRRVGSDWLRVAGKKHDVSAGSLIWVNCHHPHAYGAMTGRVVIGVRPEFARLTDGEGLPATIRRIEDVGRHRIVRAEVMGHDVNIIAGEGERIGPEMSRVWFDPAQVNVYADDWRVAPVGTVGGAA